MNEDKTLEEKQSIAIVVGTTMTIIMIEVFAFFILYAIYLSNLNDIQATFMQSCLDDHVNSEEKCAVYSKMYVEFGQKEYNRIMPILTEHK